MTRTVTLHGVPCVAPVAITPQAEVAVRSQQTVHPLQRLPDPDDCPVHRWASMSVFVDNVDKPEASRWAVGYAWDNTLAMVAHSRDGKWDHEYQDVQLPAVDLVFRDPQARDQFVDLLNKFADGRLTHVLLSPLAAHLLDTFNDD